MYKRCSLALADVSPFLLSIHTQLFFCDSDDHFLGPLILCVLEAPFDCLHDHAAINCDPVLNQLFEYLCLGNASTSTYLVKQR